MKPSGGCGGSGASAAMLTEECIGCLLSGTVFNFYLKVRSTVFCVTGNESSFGPLIHQDMQVGTCFIQDYSTYSWYSRGMDLRVKGRLSKIPETVLLPGITGRNISECLCLHARAETTFTSCRTEHSMLNQKHKHNLVASWCWA